MASFTCKCGQVKVAFAVHKCRMRTNCCCCDCYQKLEWAAANGGPTLPSAYVDKERPVAVEHWDGRVAVSGKEFLSFNKLHKNSASVNCATNCCTTLLFVDHPMYNGNTILVFPEVVEIHKSEQSTQEEALINSWIKDWPDEHRRKLDQSIPGFYMTSNGEFAGVGNWAEVMQQAGVIWSQPPVEDESFVGQSFAALLEEAGGASIVRNLEFEPRKNH